jgi:hypothetical protein
VQVPTVLGVISPVVALVSQIVGVEVEKVTSPVPEPPEAESSLVSAKVMVLSDRTGVSAACNPAVMVTDLTAEVCPRYESVSALVAVTLQVPVFIEVITPELASMEHTSGVEVWKLIAPVPEPPVADSFEVATPSAIDATVTALVNCACVPLETITEATFWEVIGA